MKTSKLESRLERWFGTTVGLVAAAGLLLAALTYVGFLIAQSR